MPLYVYEREDGTQFEVIQRITEAPLKVCPTTGQAVKRVIGKVSFHLKGTGWTKK